MKHGLWLNNGELTPSEVLKFGIAADESGWDGVFVSDSFAERGYSDPWMLLSGIATRTETVRLGTWVTPLARRQPWQVALDLATLDQLSDGRVILGGGLGVPEDFEMFGQDAEPRTRAMKLDETLEIIAGLWSGESFSFDGEHYTIDDVELPVLPVQEPRIPILLAGFWPGTKPFQRGARWDGLMPAWEDGMSETDIREMVSYYLDHTDEMGDIVMPRDMGDLPENLDALCEEVGISWQLTTCLSEDGYELDEDRVRAGPPN